MRVARQAFDFVAALRVSGSHLLVQLVVTASRLEPNPDLRAGQWRVVSAFHQAGHGQGRLQFYVEVRGVLRQLLRGRQVANHVAGDQQRAARLRLPRLERPGEAERAIGCGPGPARFTEWKHRHLRAGGGVAGVVRHRAFQFMRGGTRGAVEGLTEPQDHVRIAAFRRNVAE